MKNLICLITFILFLSCEKDNKVLPDGHYQGYFKYGTVEMWESFGIESESFVEYASGGAAYQKFPFYCLTKGTYKIRGGTIEFYNIQIAQPPNKELSTCDQDFILSGSYTVGELTDSVISFWKNSTLGKQEYKLKLFYSE